MSISSIGSKVYSVVKNTPKPVKAAALGFVSGAAVTAAVTKKNEDGSSSTLSKVVKTGLVFTVAALLLKKFKAAKLKNVVEKMDLKPVDEFGKAIEKTDAMENPQIRQAVATKVRKATEFLNKVMQDPSVTNEQVKNMLTRMSESYAKSMPKCDGSVAKYYEKTILATLKRCKEIFGV